MVSRYRDIIEANNSNGSLSNDSNSINSKERKTQNMSDSVSIGTNGKFEFYFLFSLHKNKKQFKHNSKLRFYFCG